MRIQIELNLSVQFDSYSLPKIYKSIFYIQQGLMLG